MKIEGVVISELSELDLSRWIAEKLEPKRQDAVEFHRRLERRAFGQDWPSDGPKFWICADAKPATWKWQPRDMVHDPAMTVMLMEKMAYPNSYAKMFECVMDQMYSRNTDGPRLQRAVAEAFALANGWTE